MRVLDHETRVDVALERAAEGDADRRGRLQVGCLEDLLGGPRPFLDRRVLVTPRERVGDGVGDVDLVGGRLQRAVEALAVEHEAGVDGSVRGEMREHLLRAGHLRHELGVHETRRLDAGQSGVRQPRAQLGARRGLERHFVVLETVARPHVTYAHGHSVDCSARHLTSVARPRVLD